MNKRLICLLLSLIMLLSVCLTSCANKTDDDALEDITQEASASAVTLSMFLMSEAPVSPEQEAAIELAVNRITQPKFKVKLDLTFLTADTYYAKLEENLLKQSENAYLYEEEDSEPVTEKDDLGIETLKYPDIKPNQVDIFYLSGYNKYSSYVNDGYLAMLNEEVDGASKLLKSYVSTALMSYMRSVNSGMYAIPTNRAIGEYTYLLLNKDVMDTLYYDATTTDFSSLTCEAVQDILASVSQRSDLNSQYVPLYSYTGEIDVLNFQYWGVDANGYLSNEFSIFGGGYDPTWEFGELDCFAEVNNIFNDNSFKAQVKVLNEYGLNGYYNDAAVENDGKDFAVGYIKGGAEIPAQFADKYEVVTVATPNIYTYDLYQDLFGVSAYSVSLSRSMEIITYLNTDVEFRNLLLYGIEGENYELVESSVLDANGDPYKQVKLLNDAYKMDVNKTGNTFLAYPTVDQDPQMYEYAKIQNRDVTSTLTMGFLLDYDDNVVPVEKYHFVRDVSNRVLAEMLRVGPAGWTTEFLNQLRTTVAIGDTMDEKRAIQHMSNLMQQDLNTGEVGFNYLYHQWLEDNEMYEEPDMEDETT